jgi:hypothetical protein
MFLVMSAEKSYQPNVTQPASAYVLIAKSWEQLAADQKLIGTDQTFQHEQKITTYLS